MAEAVPGNSGRQSLFEWFAFSACNMCREKQIAFISSAVATAF
jgi:hypothetical protein